MQLVIWGWGDGVGDPSNNRINKISKETSNNKLPFGETHFIWWETYFIRWLLFGATTNWTTYCTTIMLTHICSNSLIPVKVSRGVTSLHSTMEPLRLWYRVSSASFSAMVTIEMPNDADGMLSESVNKCEHLNLVDNVWYGSCDRPTLRANAVMLPSPLA